MIKCHFCGCLWATIRAEELSTAKITYRAHVDCVGHSEYRPVSAEEISASERVLAEVPASAR